MDRERIELLRKFFRELLCTATESLDSIDMLKLGIPEEQAVTRLLESFNQAVKTANEIDRYVTTPNVALEPLSEPRIPTEDEENAAIENAREVLSSTIESTMGNTPPLTRLWAPFCNDAHADIVRRGGGNYLGTKDSRVWFLDENGSSRTLRTNQLTPEAVRRKIGTKVR